MNTHTPTPWEVGATGIKVVAAHPDNKKREVTIADHIGSASDILEARANAKHIVYCVNHHDELVAQLRFVFENGHKWTGSTGEGAADWAMRTAILLSKLQP